MASPPVLTQFANPDPNAAPLTIVQLVQLLNTLVSSQIVGDYIPYIIQNTTPGADDQDKVWIYVDGGGRPLEARIWYTASGSWRRIYNGMLNEVRMFNGDPTNTSDWDSNGLGVLGGKYDGWHLCNGKDGTPDLSDKFLVAGNMSGTPYSSGWQSLIEDGTTLKHTGGHNTITLDDTHTYRKPTQEITLHEWSANLNAPANPGDLFGLTNVSAKADTLQNGDPGNLTPSPIDIVNPYIAIGYMIFVGYA